MKNIYLLTTDGCNDKLFNYPCVDLNSYFLQGKQVCVFDNNSIINKSWFTELGGSIILNPSNKDTSYAEIGIIAPPAVIQSEDDEKEYYEIIDYYVEKLQLLINKQKGTGGYNHVLVILPPHSDECGTSLKRMAYYAVYGLIKGLGAINAQYGVFINGIILGESENDELLKYWTTILCSDNANNIVGQIIKL